MLFPHLTDGFRHPPVTNLMHRRITCLLALACLPCALVVAAAQQPVRPPRPVTQRDSTAKPDSVEADSTSDDEDIPPRAITTGLTLGGLNYDGGRSERATSAVLRWHALPWLSVGTTPTFARSLEPNTIATRPEVSRSGLTDLPIEINASHAFDASLSPSLDIGLGITLPVGDTATGFGTGSVGSSISIGGGLALTDRVGVHAGAGRSLTDFSLQSTFNGTSSEFGDVGFSLQASDEFSLSVGVDGDIGQVDPAYGRAASLSGGVTMALPILNSVSFNASRGISGATPTWSFAIGVGTDFASVGSVILGSAASRLHRAFGGGRHGLVASGSPKTPTTRRKQR